ncbi:MAG: hypothetical protein HY675_23035 [Chloroflexi bacterium]|nr:hypothetical protein [Chloroflexota bacterium]
MRLDKYPRPTNDTGIGFHYFMDAQHYSDEHAQFWIPELKEMGASWLTLYAEFKNLIPESFVKELVENEIEPVVRITPPHIQPLNQGTLFSQLKAYASWGVHYVHVFNEPNIAGEWTPSDWGKPGLVERFMDILMPCLERMSDAGLYPLFTPLCQGGHYWDNTFLETALEYMVAKRKQPHFDRMAICIHNYASNRPLTWGKGGREKWTASKPYNTPPGSQDQCGFYHFEWYDEIVRSKVGQSLPFICGENGLIVGTRNHPSYPAVDEATHAQRVVEMTRMLMNGELPDYVFNNAFWVLADDGPVDIHAWYRNGGRTLPAVDALKTLEKRPRQFSWEQRSQAIKSSPRDKKPIYHYVLLAISDDGPRGEDMEAVASYVAKFAPTVGFSVQEAKMASRITILGSGASVSDLDEKELREAGCLVERIECQGSRDAKRVLGGMVRREQRFYYLPE